MVGVTGLAALVGLVLLIPILAPLGAVLLRGLERFVGHRWRLSAPERLLVALYASGGLFFLIATIPFPLFFPWVVGGLLGLGAVVYAVLSVRERGSGLRHFVSWIGSVPGLVVAAGCIGFLALYVGTIGTVPLPNGLDGGFHSLFTNLLTQNHTAPWTLQPYEPAGVEYPQGSPVWEALPVVLYGWPVVSSPILVPALFLAFTPVAAYSWGERVGGLETPAGSRMGLLFAGFFGLLASWPRLFVGGSYDFAIAVPLFLVFLGWLPSLSARPTRPWPEVIALGLLVGVTGVISAAIGLELALLIGGCWLVHWVLTRRDLVSTVLRFFAIVAIALAFLARSFIGLIVWWSYPAHVLSAAGSPPYVTPPLTTLSTGTYVIGEVDPFVPWKGKLSPFPSLSVMILVLLVIGLGLLAFALYRPRLWSSPFLPSEMARSIVIGTAVTIVFLLALIGATLYGGPFTGIQSVTSADETSTMLFIFFATIAFVPLVVAWNYLERRWRERARAPSDLDPPPSGPSWTTARPARRPRSLTGATVVALIVVAAPLALGAAVTATAVPGYLTSHVQQFSNDSAADIAALQWIGANLPECSRVLVATDSVGHLLPEFANVHLISTDGYVRNLSYNRTVDDLYAGIYNATTRTEMTELEITEVLVTGRTSVSVPAFEPGPLENSFDFTELFHQQDAWVFEFNPGVQLTGCVPPAS